MKLTYLGRYATQDVKVAVFLEQAKRVVIGALSTDDGTVVQAYRKLVLTKGSLDTDGLYDLVSAHNATIEVLTAEPGKELIEREVPQQGSKTKWLESSLKRVEAELDEAEDEYDEWRGVRDTDEARGHWRDRREQLHDLTQKIVANEKRPRFVRRHGYVPSEWQRTERFRLRELRDEAKSRASAVRRRLDWTYRRRVQELKQKKKELEKELKAERKKEADRTRKLASLTESSVAGAVLVTLRSKPVHTRGRKRAAVEEALQDVTREARAFRERVTERAGVQVNDPPWSLLLAPVFLPNYDALKATTNESMLALADAVESALAVTDEQRLTTTLKSVLKELLDGPVQEAVDMSGFPSAGDASRSRLAFLGFAMNADSTRSRQPVFYDLDEQGPRHMAVIGGSGSGKSVAASLIVESALLEGVPVLVVDPTRSWTGFAQACEGSLLRLYEEFMMDPDWARGFTVRVNELTDAGQAVDLDAVLENGLTVLTSQDLSQEDEAAVVKRVLQGLLGRMRGWRESDELRVLVVLEEAHRYLKEKELQPVLEVFARTARAKGAGLMAVSQVATDLPPAVRNNCATKIQLQTNYARDLTRAGKVFGKQYKEIIPGLSQAQGAVNYPEYGTALVAFRPPLHSPVSVPEPVERLHRVTEDLAGVVEELLSRQTTQVTRHTDTPRDPGSEAGERVEPGSWREAATRYFEECEERPVAREVREAIIEAGGDAPSLRTVQRFLKERLS